MVDSMDGGKIDNSKTARSNCATPRIFPLDFLGPSDRSGSSMARARSSSENCSTANLGFEAKLQVVSEAKANQAAAS